MKYLGIEAGLFSAQEARENKLTKNGHGVSEIACLVNERLGANQDFPVVNALTAGPGSDGRDRPRDAFWLQVRSNETIISMQKLGYLQLNPGDFALAHDLKPWVSAVRDVAGNLPVAVDVVKQWASSSGSSSSFAIWYK